MPYLIRTPFFALLFCAALAAALQLNFEPIPLGAFNMTELGAKFFSLTLVALAIERAVEIYIANRFPPESTKDIAQAELTSQKIRAATRASLVMSLALAIVGVRLLAQIAPTEPLAPLQARGFHVVDIILTALLLSGGADGMHHMINGALRRRAPSPV